LCKKNENHITNIGDALERYLTTIASNLMRLEPQRIQIRVGVSNFEAATAGWRI
jgi:hypothetical protein